MVQTNQRTIEVGKLYRVVSLGDAYIEQNINYSIWVNTGAVDVYGSDSGTQPTALADMTLASEDTAVAGKKLITALPAYLALAQNGATAPTEIVLTGVEITDLGGIA